MEKINGPFVGPGAQERAWGRGKHVTMVCRDKIRHYWSYSTLEARYGHSATLIGDKWEVNERGGPRAVLPRHRRTPRH